MDQRGLETQPCWGNELHFRRIRREVTGSGDDQFSGHLGSILYSIQSVAIKDVDATSLSTKIFDTLQYLICIVTTKASGRILDTNLLLTKRLVDRVV